MERQQLLEKIAPYLPYGVKVSDIHTLNTGKGIGGLSHILTTKSEEYKLRLRPLSDLTKEIQIGEYYCSFFEHLERINPNTKETKNCALMLDASIEFHYWRDYQFLLKNHFDVFGLIEDGYAVDINTL